MRPRFTVPVLFLSLLILGLTACGGRPVSLKTDPDEIPAIAAEIADFEPPAGYSAEIGADFMGYAAVAYGPRDSHSHLYLIQSDDEADAETLAAELNNLDPGAGDAQARMILIDTKPTVVRGDETTLFISEGINSDGATYRQAMVAFQGKGGPALLIWSEPIDRWNQQTAEAFITSIR